MSYNQVGCSESILYLPERSEIITQPVPPIYAPTHTILDFLKWRFVLFLFKGCWQLPGRMGHCQAWKSPIAPFVFRWHWYYQFSWILLKFGSLSLKKIFQELTVWCRAEMIRYQCGSLPITWRVAGIPGAQWSVRAQYEAHSPSAKGHHSGGGQLCQDLPDGSWENAGNFQWYLIPLRKIRSTNLNT